MINLEVLKAILEGRKQEIEKKEHRELTKIETRRKEELKSVNDRYNSERDAQVTGFNAQREKLDQEFYRKGSIELLASLDEEYAATDNRENAVLISEDDKAKARTYIKALKKAESVSDANTREAIVTGIRLGITPSIERAMQIVQQDSGEPRVITSYIAAGKINKVENGVLIAAPVRSDRSNTFSDSLDDLIMQTARSERILLDYDALKLDLKQSTVCRDRNSEVKISTHKKTVVNGYAVYTIIPNKPEEANKLMEGIQMRLKELQMSEWKDANLSYTLQPVDIEIIKYFMTHGREDLGSPIEQITRLMQTGVSQLSYEQTAHITGMLVKTIKRHATQKRIQLAENGEVNLQSLKDYLSNTKIKTSYEEVPAVKRIQDRRCSAPYSTQMTEHQVKSEAYRRLEETAKATEGLLNGNQLCYVLGISRSGGPTTVAQKPDMISFVVRKGEGERQRLYFRVEGVRKYIDSRFYNHGKWICINSGENVKNA